MRFLQLFTMPVRKIFLRIVQRFFRFAVPKQQSTKKSRGLIAAAFSLPKTYVSCHCWERSDMK